MSISVLQLPHQDLFSSPERGSWYALATMSRHERLVVYQLNERGMCTFLPSKIEIHRWSDRRRRVEVPLFPGYVFLHAIMSTEIRRMATYLRGSAGFVMMQGEPVAIPPEQIETVQRLVTKNILCAPYSYLHSGQRVRIRGGSLDGIEGVLLQTNGNKELVISIHGIGRSLAVRIDGYDIEAL